MSYRLTFSLSLSFAFLSFFSQGQDLIVRIYGDTIHCKVDQEDERFVYYRTESTSRGETEIISHKEIREILYDAEKSVKRNIAARKFRKEYETFQISVQAGYSWILSADDLYGDDFESLYDEMREGAFIDVRANYFFNSEVGLGALYSSSRYQTNSTIPVLVNLPSGKDLAGGLRHNRSLNYYALNVAFRLDQNSSNMSFQIDVGLGVLSFEDRGEFIGAYRLNSNSIGGHFSASFSLGLGEGFYLPATVSIKGFRLSTFDLKPSDEMDPELAVGLQDLYDNLEGGINANRLQVGLGLGFAF